MSDLPAFLNANEQLTVYIVCPSFGKICGIQTYATHIVEEMRNLGREVRCFNLCRDASEAAREQNGSLVVFFHHEYSFLDSNSHLSSDETVSDVLHELRTIEKMSSSFFSVFVMHTIVTSDEKHRYINSQIIRSNIPVVHFNREGAATLGVNFAELGVWRKEMGIRHTNESAEITIGAYGLLSENKNVAEVINLSSIAAVSLRANFTSNDQNKIDEIDREVTRRNVSGEVTYNFLSDENLLRFLGEVTFVYSPQHDFSHYATSGSARTALAAGVPIVVTPHRPFHDLISTVVFATSDSAVDFVESLKLSRDETINMVAESARPFRKAAELGHVHLKLANKAITKQLSRGGTAKIEISDFFVDELPGRMQFDSKKTSSLLLRLGIVGPLSILELVSYPRYVRQLILERHLEIDILEDIEMLLDITQKMKEEQEKERFDPPAYFLLACQISQIIEKHYFARGLLTWSEPMLMYKRRFSKYYIPENILFLGSEDFVKECFIQIIGRTATAHDVAHHLGLFGRYSKSKIFFALCQSPEGLSKQIVPIGDLEKWDHQERSLMLRLEILRNIAPSWSRLIERNIRIIDDIYR